MRNRLVVAGAIAVALIVLQVVLDRTSLDFDLTAERTLTLTHETTQILHRVRRPVRITAFVRRSEPGRPEAAALLDRYHRADRHITGRVLDPDDAPGEVQRLDIDPAAGGVALQMDGRIERGPTVTEQDITGGIARLLRGRSATVCALAGHGEPAIDGTGDDGLSTAADLLRRNGYRVEAADLLASTSIPPSCQALLLVRPTAALGDAAGVVSTWLAGGGKAVVLADPVSTVDLTPVLEPFGVTADRGIVFERDPASHLPGDEVTPVVRSYVGASPVARRLPPTVFPGVEALSVVSRPGEGLAVAGFARTSPASYLSHHPESQGFDPATDKLGPITIAASADKSRNEEGRVVRSRLVVAGDADFATNAFIGDAGNSHLVLQAVDWVTLDEDLVTLSTHLPDVRPLALTDARGRYVTFLTVFVVPALWLLAGAMVWAVRRGR